MSINFSKPVFTVSGRPVRILATDLKGTTSIEGGHRVNYPIVVGSVHNPLGFDYVYRWRHDGKSDNAPEAIANNVIKKWKWAVYYPGYNQKHLFVTPYCLTAEGVKAAYEDCEVIGPILSTEVEE